MAKILITGGAGFIGSNIAKFYENNGVVIIDDLKKSPQIRHIKYQDYLNKDEFIQKIQDNYDFGKIDAIFHQGANSDTMATDADKMRFNNFSYSQILAKYALRHKIPMIYASSAAVYGDKTIFTETPNAESPLNIYGQSKCDFDNWVRSLGDNETQSLLVGLRYFNVYGPGENHKNRMASVAFHHYNQWNSVRKVKLFKGSHGFEDGGQLRDFIHIDDVVAVNDFFLNNGVKGKNWGIFNCGTGRAESFNQVALAVINHGCQTNYDLSQAINQGYIEYIDFYDGLLAKYQAFTKADISNLRLQGYTKEFLSVRQGVQKYCAWLDENLINME